MRSIPSHMLNAVAHWENMRTDSSRISGHSTGHLSYLLCPVALSLLWTLFYSIHRILTVSSRASSPQLPETAALSCSPGQYLYFELYPCISSYIFLLSYKTLYDQILTLAIENGQASCMLPRSLEFPLIFTTLGGPETSKYLSPFYTCSMHIAHKWMYSSLLLLIQEICML